MKKPQSLGSKMFDVMVTVLLVVIGIIVAYPLIYVLSASVSDYQAVNSGKVWLLPVGLQWEGYIGVFENLWIMRGYRNSLFYTLAGTFINVAATVTAGYALSRMDLFGRKFLNWYIIFPMWFGGGLIPTYLLLYNMGMVNTPYILLIMGLVSPYNIIICRTFMKGLPFELQEAAKIDGASDFQVLRSIILPVAAPIIAVLSLYYAVGHWNNYFNAMIYVSNREWQPLQVFLREILLLNESITPEDMMNVDMLVQKVERAQVMKYSLIVVASVPLLILYPFLQKFFAKGVMVGALKG